jgi:hypothetical protein
MTTSPMFPATPAAPLKLSALLAHHRDLAGTYSAYKPVKRVPCEECVAVLHESGGVGDPPRTAVICRRARRSSAAAAPEPADTLLPGFENLGKGKRPKAVSEDLTLLLCREHGDMLRKHDGIGEKRGR